MKTVTARIMGKAFEIDERRLRGGVAGRPEGRKLLMATDPAHGRPGTDEATRLSGVTAERSTPSAFEYNGQVYRSKTEVRFAQYLDGLFMAALITSWQYEPCNIRLLGKKNFYKPDFFIVDEHQQSFSHRCTYVDTKGRNKSDDRSLVKIKTAAGLNRWAHFCQYRWRDNQWDVRHIAA